MKQPMLSMCTIIGTEVLMRDLFLHNSYLLQVLLWVQGYAGLNAGPLICSLVSTVSTIKLKANKQIKQTRLGSRFWGCLILKSPGVKEQWTLHLIRTKKMGARNRKALELSVESFLEKLRFKQFWPVDFRFVGCTLCIPISNEEDISK